MCGNASEIKLEIKDTLKNIAFLYLSSTFLFFSDSANILKTLLSFAVGGILGDVFLHSMPEIWANDAAQNGKYKYSNENY